MNDQDQSIWDRYRLGRNARQIGRELDVSYRTVQRRLNEHGGMKPAERRPKPTKLAQDQVLRNDVVEGLAKKWSPEQIAGRLAVDYPDDPDRRISFESIY